MKSKRLLSVICIICQIAMIMSFSFTANAAETDSLTQRFINFGVYDPADRMEATEEYMDRETFAVIISQFCGLDRNASYPVTGVYADVTGERRGAGVIEVLSTSGIITSYTDGLFRPDSAVTYGAALKAFINILGYTPVANLKGGWPNGYIEQAIDLELTAGVVKNYDEPVTKGEFSKMLNAFLVTDMMSVVANSNESGKFVVNYGKTPLNTKLDIHEFKGVLTATDLTALEGYTKTSKNTVAVEGTLFDTEKSLHDYLGMYVEVYYKQGREDYIGTIVDISVVEKRNNYLEINSEDISSASTVTNLVYSEGKKLKSAEIHPEATLIFNGVSKPVFTEKDLIPLNGSVKLIDSNNDNVYETVTVKSYIDFVLATVNNDGSTFVMVDKVSGKQAEFAVSETKIKVVVDGKETVTGDLAKDMTVSIAASDVDTDTLTIKSTSTNVEVVATSNTVSGVITGGTGMSTHPVSDDPADGTYKAYETLTIDDTEYPVSPFYNFVKYPVDLAKTAKVYLNTKGEILMISSTGGLQYGVIENAATEGGLDSVLKVKLFNSQGKHVTLDAVNNVIVDGIRYNSPADALLAIKRGGNLFAAETGIVFDSGNATEQLIRYKLNEEEKIVEIDTVVSTTKEASDALKYGMQFEGGYKLAYTLSSASTGKDVIGYSGDALIFKAPTDATNEEAYSVGGKSSWTGDTFKNKVILFDMDEYNVAHVLYMPVGAATAPVVDEADETNIALVKKVYTSLSSEGEAVLTADAMYQSGEEFTIQIKDKTVLGGRTIKRGDLIKWTGEVTNPSALQICISVENQVVLATSEKLSPEKPYSQYYHSFRILYGTVERIGEEFMLVRCGEGDFEIHETCRLTDITAVFEVDSTAGTSRTNIGYASLVDIKSEDNFGENASKVLVIESYGKPKTVIIYR